MPTKKEDYWIRPRKQLLEYQIGFFNREINRLEKQYEAWIAKMPMRTEKLKPRYQTIDEVNEAYLAGLLTDEECRREKSATWHTFSDRGSKRKLAWLYAQLEQYENQYEALLAYTSQMAKDNAKRRKVEFIKREKTKRRELKRAEQKAREEACKYWKHIYDDVEGE